MNAMNATRCAGSGTWDARDEPSYVSVCIVSGLGIVTVPIDALSYSSRLTVAVRALW